MVCALWVTYGFISPSFAQGTEPVELTTLTALSEDERAAYNAVEHDPRPKSLTRNSHYVVSDEKDHYLLKESIKGIGGAYIGVGTNQNYEFIPWSQSDVVFLLDFDQLIVDLHSVYQLAFEHSADPAAFVKFWSRGHVKTVESLISKHISIKQKRQAALAAYKMARVATLGKLKRLVRLHQRKRVTSYLTSLDQYRYIVGLFKAGRVFMVRGDLTAQKTMRQISEALKRFNRYLGVIYVSNCEQYFHKLPKTYRANMLRFPVSERSLVLRTRPWLESIEKDDSDLSKPKTCANCKTRGTLHYAYMYQDFKNLRAWLTDSNTTSLWQMVSKRSTRIKHRAYHQTHLPKNN
ncbi:MAG: hypothetical protein CMH52_14190 [Myxococcales bacterium]|nr:hypothetical protein [Myxococcales bacterium]